MAADFDRLDETSRAINAAAEHVQELIEQLQRDAVVVEKTTPEVAARNERLIGALNTFVEQLREAVSAYSGAVRQAADQVDAIKSGARSVPREPTAGVILPPSVQKRLARQISQLDESLRDLDKAKEAVLAS